MFKFMYYFIKIIFILCIIGVFLRAINILCINQEYEKKESNIVEIAMDNVLEKLR